MKIEYWAPDGIGRITLAHPPPETLTRPDAAGPTEIESFLELPELKAVIVAGSGRRSPGDADQESRRTEVSRPGATRPGRKTLVELLAFAPVPTMALIRGVCLGAELEIALACHFRFAASTATLDFSRGGLTVLAGPGGAIPPRRIPTCRLVDQAVSGRFIGASEAFEIGLVDRVEPVEAVEDAAGDFLRALTGNRSARLIRAVMEGIHAGRRLPLFQALRRETELFQKVAAERG